MNAATRRESTQRTEIKIARILGYLHMARMPRDMDFRVCGYIR